MARPTASPFHEPPPAPAPASPRTPLIPRRAAMALVTTLTVLLLLLRFDPGMNATSQVASTSAVVGDATTSDQTLSGSADTTNGSTSNGSTSTNGSTTTNGSTSNGATTASTQVTGDAVDTRFGTVQVQVTVEGGTIVDVTALQLPTGGRNSQESAYAEPILRSEALQAGSARIDTVSGATYTSMGYIQSLQSALDSAGIG
jgi:uncharacterized protein with FMN-binding domain